MSDAARNKEVSRRWIEVFNARDDDAEAGVRAADYVAYAPPSLEAEPLDSAGWVAFLGGFLEGFPDLTLTIEDQVAEGDLVTQRLHFEGTHTGTFQGLPPTGKKISLNSIEINRHDADGKIVEHWFQLDALTMLQQIGLIVIPGPRLVPRLLLSPLRKLRRKS